MTELEDDLPTPEGMSEAELCAAIDKESRQAFGQGDELSDKRKTGLEFYMGQAKGELAPPESEGRSKIVSKDLMDVVEWMMPDMMRLFGGAEQVVRFEPDSPEDEQGAQDATHYCTYVAMEQNPGFTLLHDAIKNSLIQRMGIVKVYVDDAWDEREERYCGIDPMSLEALMADPEVELVSAEPDEYGQIEAIVKRKKRVKKYKIDGVPPEEFRMNSDARSIEDARFTEHKVLRTLSDLRSMGLDTDKIERLASDMRDDPNGEAEERNDLHGSWAGREDPADESQRTVMLSDAYIRIDFDGDGVAEFRHVLKAGNVVFENEVTDDHPFCLFSPILMPYQAIGLGMYDLVEDLQRIKTALTRQMLDNAYLANNPIREVVETQVTMDDLLNPRVGGLVRVKQPGMIRDMTVPFIGPQALTLLEHFDMRRDARTGVMEQSQGLNQNALAGSSVGSQGVESLQAAAAQRKELIARVFAEGPIKRLFRLVLKLVTQHSNKPEQIKVNGRWLEVDPREWKTQYRLTVSVGIGSASRQAQLANLQALIGLQERAAAYGLATPENAFNALTRLCEQMGYKDADQFFSRPDENPPPPQPSPEEIKAQAAMALQQMKGEQEKELAGINANLAVQTEQMKQDSQQRQSTQESEIELRKHELTMAQEKELRLFEAQLSQETERYKADLAYQQAIRLAEINAAKPQPQEY